MVHWLACLIKKQFEVDRFVISEPIAKIGLSTANKPVQERKSSVNLAHQIAQFYPAVKTILDQFDIAFFKVERAALDLQKTSSNIEVRLLDLLVSDWNMRDLADDARFRLSLGNQSLQFYNASFSFASIVYDYNTNELDILNYSYSKADSLDRMLIQASGESLRIMNLDYQQLVLDEHYQIEGLLIEKPKVSLHLYPDKQHQPRNKHPIADLVRKSLGALHLETGKIQEAQLEFTVHRAQDTMSIKLPKLNLVVDDFAVTYDSATVMFNHLNLNVHQSTINLGNELGVRFANLSYDENYHVLIDSIRVINNQSDKDLIWCQQMNLYGFNAFQLVLDKELALDSILLQNGRLDIIDTPEILVNNPNINKQSDDNRRFGIGRIKLNHIDALLEREHYTITAQDLSGTIDNFHRGDPLGLKLRNLSASYLSFNDSNNLQLDCSNLAFDPSKLLLGSIEGSLDKMAFTANRLSAEPYQFDLNSIDLNNWKRIELGHLKLEGEVPPPSKDTTNTRLSDESQTLGRLIVNDFKANLLMPDGGQIETAVEDFRLEDLVVQNHNARFEFLSATVKQSNVQMGDSHYFFQGAAINSDSVSVVNQLDIKVLNRQQLKINSIYLDPFNLTSESFATDNLTSVDIWYEDKQGRSVSTMDSLSLLNIKVQGATPHVEQVVVYSPDISIPVEPKQGPDTEQEKSFDSIFSTLPQLLDRVLVLPGRLKLGEQQVVFDNLALDLSKEYPEFDFQKLAFKSETHSIHVGGIWSDPSHIFLDSLYLVPLPGFVNQISSETDVIAGLVNRVQFHQVNWDTLKQEGKLVTDSLTLEGFDLSIKRDKMLPDLNHLEKPYLLEDFMPVPEQVVLPKIIGHQGRVVYIEKGEMTGLEGFVSVDDIHFTLNYNQPINQSTPTSSGRALLYNEGSINYQYHRLDSGDFNLSVSLSDMPLELFNQMVDPLEAAKFKSGQLDEFRLEMIGDSISANGQGIISYHDLHVEIYKSHQPDVKNLGSELLTLLVDKLLLKHSKSDAVAAFTQDRIPYKSPINYWVKSGIHAASVAVMKGKTKKKKKQSKSKKRN